MVQGDWFFLRDESLTWDKEVKRSELKQLWLGFLIKDCWRNPTVIKLSFNTKWLGSLSRSDKGINVSSLEKEVCLSNMVHCLSDGAEQCAKHPPR